MADPGGGVQGVRTPPPFGPRCRLFNIGPKVGPPPFVNVQEWGCFSIFLRSDDVAWTMSKGGGACEKSCICAWTPPFQKSSGSAAVTVLQSTRSGRFLTSQPAGYTLVPQSTRTSVNPHPHQLAPRSMCALATINRLRNTRATLQLIVPVHNCRPAN